MLIGRMMGKKQIQKQRAEYLAAGMQRMTPTIAARSMPRDGTQHFRVHWHYDLGPGQNPLFSEVVYYCRVADRASQRPLRVEMVEYKVSALDVLRAHHARQADATTPAAAAGRT